MKYIAITLSFISALFMVEQGHAAPTVKDAVAIWLFDEGAGNTVKDMSENGNDGEITGNAKWVDGKFKKGLQLPQNAKVGSATAEGVSPTFISECLWVNFEDFGTENQFGYINAPGGASPRFFYFSTWCAAGPPHNCIHLGTIDGAGAWGRGFAIDPLFEENTWYFVCGVVNNEEGTLRAYVDGKLKHEEAIAKGDTPGTPTEIWLGGTPENYQWIQGTVDEVAFFNVALTEDDIQAFMKNGVVNTVLAVQPQDKLATTWGDIKSR